MKRVEGDDRHQVALLPECLDDFIDEDNLSRRPRTTADVTSELLDDVIEGQVPR